MVFWDICTKMGLSKIQESRTVTSKTKPRAYVFMVVEVVATVNWAKNG